MKDRQTVTLSGVRIRYVPGTDPDAEALEAALARIGRLTGSRASDPVIAKKSVDARRDAVSFVYTVAVSVPSGRRIPDHPSLRVFSEPSVEIPLGEKILRERPVVVGFGPAGMFCAYLLALAGMRPLVLERGAPVDERAAAVERFVREGVLDPESNVQFGAGGAGTFSDGKLTTRIGDPLTAWVLEKLVSFGAPEDILYKAKPHVGTDVLRTVVKNADEAIRSLSGEIRYHTKASLTPDGRLSAGGEVLPRGVAVLAVGHSARDTYSELMANGFLVEPKAFSVGVRAEHLQADIDRALYHGFAGDPVLGPGEYQLSARHMGRGCYTFCMCPGGVVVPSSSEEGTVVTNGMSSRARDGRNANSAVCVSVLPSDFDGSPAGAIAFQRELEKKAFLAGGGTYAAPVQSIGDFFDGKKGEIPSRIRPTYRDGAVVPSDLNGILPPFVTEALKAGLYDFGKKIAGFCDFGVPLTGVETRTSAPVRIVRGEDGCAVGMPGVYPCGEGAGYAGGIMSAAVDGIRTAQKILSVYRAG